MSVTRYRSVAEMPPPWRDRDDPDNLRRVAEMLTFHRLTAEPPRGPRMQRFQSLDEANASRDDPYRRGPRAGPER